MNSVVAAKSSFSVYLYPPEHYLGLPRAIEDNLLSHPPDLCRDFRVSKEQADKIHEIIEDRFKGSLKPASWEYISSKILKLPCKIVLHSLSKQAVIIPKKRQIQTASGHYKICRMALHLTVVKTERVLRRICHQKEPKESLHPARPSVIWERESALNKLFTPESNPFVPKYFEISSFEGKVLAKHPRHGFYKYYPEDLHNFFYRGGMKNVAILKEIVNKITYLVALMHKKEIAHRDFKLENVLIGGIPGRYTLAVCDVDQAVQAGEKVENLPGTPLYWPPEQIKCLVTKDLQSLPLPHIVDLYGLAVIFYQFIHKDLPFWSKKRDPSCLDDWLFLLQAADKYKTVSDESIKIIKDVATATKLDFKTHLSHLTNWMLHPNPSKRPSFVIISQILKIIKDKD